MYFNNSKVSFISKVFQKVEEVNQSLIDIHYIKEWFGRNPYIIYMLQPKGTPRCNIAYTTQKYTIPDT